MIVKIFINDKEYEVSDNETLLNTCEKLGIFIPHLCYLKGYTPEGVCGLCAVEIDDSRVALSCMTQLVDGMKIKTETRRLIELRKINIDNLLRHHNINCLNCSKNGSCELQKYTTQIYEKSIEQSTLVPDKKVSDFKKLSRFIYDGSKCVECNKCVKFLNKFCGKNLKKISALDDIDESYDLAFNSEELCPTDSLAYEKGIRPEFLMEKIETFDISDVFTPRVLIFKNEEKIEKIKSAGDSLISDKTRIHLKKIPERFHSDENYQKIIDILTEKLKTETHEKNVFIVGDDLDIVSLFYIKAFAKHLQNVCISINDCQFPTDSDLTIGLTQSELPTIDFAMFVGDISDITRYHITSYSTRIKEIKSFNFEDFGDFFEKYEENNFANYSAPMLFISIDEFEKHTPEVVIRKLKDFSDQYFSKYAKNLKIKILPTNLSQMIMNHIPNRIPLTVLFEKYNRHDLNFICVVGNLNYDLKTDGIFTVYNSVYNKEDCEYIPAKHFVEDEIYHMNVFGEIVKTKKAITNNLKSHREFLFDLMKNVFGDKFGDINYEVHRSIRKAFFE